MKSLVASGTRLGHLLVVLLPSFLTGCTLLESPGGRISMLVVLPLLFIGVLLWAIRLQRRGRLPDRDDRRGYPDYDDRD